MSILDPGIAGLVIESGIANPAERFLAYADLDSAGLQEDEVLAEVERRFDHQSKLAGYEHPVLILHTENDGLIDISHAERNHQWAGSMDKKLIRLPNGNHNTILPANVSQYLNALRSFVKGVAATE